MSVGGRGWEGESSGGKRVRGSMQRGRGDREKGEREKKKERSYEMGERWGR